MAHKDQKDDKKSKGKSKKDGTALPAATSPVEKKSSKLKPYPLPVTRKCSCLSPFQDSLYGKQMRLHNPAKKMTGLRCTVCNHETS